MNITIKTLSALAIAAATLAVTALPSSALPSYIPPGAIKGIGQPAKPAAPPAWQRFGNLHGPFKCLVCDQLPPKQPPVGPSPNGGDHDHDHGWNHWHNWRGGPEIVVEGIPETTVVAAPAQSAPVRMSAPAAPARASAPVSQQLAAEPCNCLTKQSLPDGSVLFQDICTKESAIAAPQQAVGAR